MCIINLQILRQFQFLQDVISFIVFIIFVAGYFVRVKKNRQQYFNLFYIVDKIENILNIHLYY